MTHVATTAAHTKDAATRTIRRESTKPLILPLAFTIALAAFGLVPAIYAHVTLFWSVVGAAAALLVGTAALLASAASRQRTLTIEVMLRKQHYLQACAQGSVLLYWGWHWPQVYDSAPLLAAQLVFAYAFDMLLAWSRRDTYTLGFAPFPVIFSINLFLWFKPDWFYLQFLMIAVGFAAKELIRWDKDGRRAHIFNPSSFPLAVFSVGLILTGTTSWTWGPEIARTQFNPPNIYLMLFLIGLPGQYLFGVTTMTMSAVLTTYLFGVVYFALTGAYFFVDSYIPIAVFLGMHLLFTDPSTSPRSELGRIFFGILYGLGNVVLYELLGRMGIPTFYDKLLPVPIMNLSIKLIDRAATASWLKRFDPARLGRSLAPRRRNLAYMTVGTMAFIAMSATDGIGDSHPGHRVPFWQQACQQNARDGCSNLALILDTYCEDGSGWACNEVGALRFHRRVDHPERANENFLRACSLGFATACQNAVAIPAGIDPRTTAPRVQDYPVILREGKGALPDRTPLQFLTRACSQGWSAGCQDLGAAYLKGDGTPRDAVRAAAAFEQACSGGLATACSNFGLMYYNADGVPRDREKALASLKRACDLGLANGCRWLKEIQDGNQVR
jgi:hypothetical protein